MELLLHFTWQQRLFPLAPLTTTDGRSIEVIDPGLHNSNAGPDFFNAKVKIDGTLWVGNVEVHTQSSDWFKHHHDNNEHYGNVILHVVEHADCPVIVNGAAIPQLELAIPETIKTRFDQLMKEENYPPCHQIIGNIPRITVNQWLTQLRAERLEQKMERIETYLKQSCNNWEDTFFITIARNFGFGVNNDIFEAWAKAMPLSAMRKHLDNAFQVEALFFGMAGLLNTETVSPDRQDAHFKALAKEFDFLKHKFQLQPLSAGQWKFLRMRPQNFPQTRLAQLLHLFQGKQLTFSQLLDAKTLEDYSALLSTHVDGYWTTHLTFGTALERAQQRALQRNSLSLLLINAVAPLLFCYGRHHHQTELCEQAFDLLEQLKAEDNWIVRSWAEVGINAENAADSQALIQLKRAYCERKDCLRCRFGRFYLKKR